MPWSREPTNTRRWPTSSSVPPRSYGSPTTRDCARMVRLYSSCIDPLGRCTQSGTSGFTLALDWHALAPSTPPSSAMLLRRRCRWSDDTLLLQLLEHLLYGVVPERRLGHLHVLLHRIDDSGKCRGAFAQEVGPLRQAADAGGLGRTERLEQLVQRSLGRRQ